ncbi:MAG: hypothetical protein V4717_02645 [Bacteroidota bacterium]
MKKITAITLLFIAITNSIFAQSEKYQEFMKKNIATVYTAATTDDFQNAANNFERIAVAEKEQWQPYYFAGYSLVMKAFFTKDKSQVDGICDKADELIAIAESLNNNNSEITTLKAMVLQARLSVDQSRGMTMGPKSSMLLQQALTQQPANNPRTYTQLAQTMYYTPTAFGGGKDVGIGMLKKAMAAYETFKPASELDPNWGKEYAEGLLAQWSK